MPNKKKTKGKEDPNLESATDKGQVYTDFITVKDFNNPISKLQFSFENKVNSNIKSAKGRPIKWTQISFGPVEERVLNSAFNSQLYESFRHLTEPHELEKILQLIKQTQTLEFNEIEEETESQPNFLTSNFSIKCLRQSAQLSD